MDTTSLLDLLKNHIDISQVPFSDRGSRLLLFREPARNCLYIKLAERLISLDANPEAYLQRKPLIRDIELIDRSGAALDFNIISTPQLLTLETRLGTFEIAFQDSQTIAFHPPAGSTCGLRFKVFPIGKQYSQNGKEESFLRDLVYQVNTPIYRRSVNQIDEGYAVELILTSSEDTTISFFVPCSPKPVPPVHAFSEIRKSAKTRWCAWFSRVPEVDIRFAKTYALAWWVMANNLLDPLGEIKFEAMAPSKVGYVGLWLWDSSLHALAYRHVDPSLARDQLRAMFAHQLPNGMLPDAVFDEGIVTEIDHPIHGEVTKPPIMAWAVIKINENDPDIHFLQEMYEPLVKLGNWWFDFNDDDKDGIAQYNHPYSSGLDDSPLWDEGMPVESPDLNTYLYLHLVSLAEIARKINKPDDADALECHAELLVKKMIEHLWNENTGYFQALRNHQPIDVFTPFNLYPLWTGALPDEMRDRLIQHLVNPEEFWGQRMLPTVARNDPKFDSKTMWRGPIWININYFFIEVLLINNEVDLANQLREITLQIIMGQEGIFEYFDAITGNPPSKAMNPFGWTAALFIDLAIQASDHEKH